MLRQKSRSTVTFSFLRQARDNDRLLQDVIKLEEVQILNFLKPYGWRLRLFSHNVTEVTTSIRAGEQPEIKKKVVALIFRKGKLVRKF